MRLTRRIIASLVLVFSFSVSYVLPPVALTTLVVTQTACPSESQLDRAVSASKNLAHYTGQAITITDGLFTAGAIKIELKDSIADKLILLSKAGKAFNERLATLDAQYRSGQVPPALWSQLITDFDGVTKPFVELLTLIPQAAGLKDSKAFRIIAASVIAISKILMENGVNRPQFRLMQQEVTRLGLV